MPERFNDEFWNYVDQLVGNSKVAIDRPQGEAHPDYPDSIYPLDYGYLAGTSSADGSGVDVWLGTADRSRVDGVICMVDLIKRDAEIKILLGCTEADMQQIVEFMNEDSTGVLLVRR